MLNEIEIPEFHPRAKLSLVTYLSQGLKVKGYLAIPKGKGPFPLLIYCRGGIRKVGMTRLAWVSHFVERGYAVFAPFYRGNRGGEGREDFAGQDRYDVIEAIPFLASHPLVDTQRIHLFGFSRGALMALFTAMECKNVRSVVVWGGVSDVTLSYEERIDLRRMFKRALGGTPRRCPEAYRYRSVLERVEELRCPVLIIHGTKDQQVGVKHAYLLADALKRSKKEFTLSVFEGAGHFLSPSLFIDGIDHMFEWLGSLPNK
jgi:dipeptidyl aminopeptidase/acylaminoacyl peptidase